MNPWWRTHNRPWHWEWKIEPKLGSKKERPLEGRRKRDSLREMERERGAIAISQTAWLSICLISQGVMSNDAPTGSAAIGCLAHYRSVLKWRQTHQKRTHFKIKRQVERCSLLRPGQKAKLTAKDALGLQQTYVCSHQLATRKTKNPFAI